MTMAFVALILGLVGILILFTIVYPKYYKSKINKNLASGKPIRTIEPIYIYGGLMFLIIIILGITTLTSIRTLESNVSVLSSKVQSLEFDNKRLLEDVWTLDENVNRAITANSYIQFIEFEVIDEVENETDMYNVKLTFLLTKNSEGSDVYLVIESNSGTESYPLEELSSRQSIELQLGLKEDYTLYIEVDNGIETEVYDFEPFNLYYYLMDRFSVYLEFDTQGDEAIFNYYINNSWENPSVGVPVEGLKIEEVHVVIKSNDIIISDEKYTTANVASSHSEIYSRLFKYDMGGDLSGSFQIIITITDNYGIVYSNIPTQR